jgi:hypothetical protein
MGKLEDKLNKIAENISNIDVTLAQQAGLLDKQSALLAEHIKRSDLNEEDIKMLRADFNPVKDNIIMLQGAFKFFVVLVSIAGVIASLVKIFF